MTGSSRFSGRTLSCVALSLLLGASTAAAHSPVTKQARDLDYSQDILEELASIFDEDPNADYTHEHKHEQPSKKGEKAEAEAAAEKEGAKSPSSGTVETTVGEDEFKHPRIIEGGASVPTLGTGWQATDSYDTHPTGLSVEEVRAVENRVTDLIERTLYEKGFDPQALTVKYETLSSIKVVLLLAAEGLSDIEMRDELYDARLVIERDVLALYFPNVRLSPSSNFTVANTRNSRIAEASILLFQMDRPDYRVEIRERPLPIPTAPPPPLLDVKGPEEAAVPETISDHEMMDLSPTPSTRPGDDSTSKRTELQLQGGLDTPPPTPSEAEQEVFEKIRSETLTPSEDDFLLDE